MGFGQALISFTASSLIRSADANADFNALNNAATFNGGLPYLFSDSGSLASDGSGNLRLRGSDHGIGKSAVGDMFVLSPSTVSVPTFKATTAIAFQIGGSTIVQVTSAGMQLLAGKVFMQQGTLTRILSISGTAAGIYNHGMTDLPNMVLPVSNAGAANDFGFNQITATTVTIYQSLASNWIAMVVQF